MSNKLIMRYNKPAEDSDLGWERQSLPQGNGYFGANFFGRYDTERVQITSNEYANPLKQGGLNNFAELYFDFNHSDVKNYSRGLDLSNAVSFCEYEYNGAKYQRNTFVSYPDNCMVLKFSCDKPLLSFDMRMVIPYLNAEPDGEPKRKTGTVTVAEGKLVMRGTLPLHGLIFEAQSYVDTDGELIFGEDKICVKNSNYANIYFVCGTNYKLCPEVFLENECTKKAMGEDPHEKVTALMENAVNLGYDKLYNAHVADYSELFSRVELNLTDGETDKATDELLQDFIADDSDLHIEELYYQFGRYLLISSSRIGTLPSSLQGVWNVHDKSPWGCGYWHNINVQMNYWPAFTTNLAETFPPFADFVKAYLPRAQQIAGEYIKEIMPENYVDSAGENGWAIGTGSNAYSINPPESHSGPGTGGLTSLLFYDYYDFTRDENVLNDTAYPILSNMAKFLIKCVKNYDGRYLTALSASPEQSISVYWINQLGTNQMYYQTVGCAFDQQLIYENGKAFLECAELLDKKDELYYKQKEQIDCYDPIHIGYSGQIKEFEEEDFYGEICEANHRHISQLMAVMPGKFVNSKTDAWMDAAKKTLEYRGDKSTGWALAHRLCVWARTGDGEHAYHLFKTLIKTRTYDNLWDWHPPFQIDGNFGAVAGVTEMLLQSHEGFLNILPTLPKAWKNGSFKGLKARGNFTVDCKWKDGCIEALNVESVCGNVLKIKVDYNNKLTVKDEIGNNVSYTLEDDIVTIVTEIGKKYIITGFEHCEKLEPVSNLFWAKDGSCVKISWDKTEKATYRVYKAIDDASTYTYLCDTADNCFVDDFDSNNYIQTYKVTKYDGKDLSTESVSSCVTVHNASKLQIDRYKHLFRQNNL